MVNNIYCIYSCICKVYHCIVDRLLKVMVIMLFLNSVVMVLVHIFMDHQMSFMLVCIQFHLLLSLN